MERSVGEHTDISRSERWWDRGQWGKRNGVREKAEVRARWQPHRSSRVERAKCWSQLIPSTCFETKACALDPLACWGRKGMGVGRQGGWGWGQTVDCGSNRNIKGLGERDEENEKRKTKQNRVWEDRWAVAKIKVPRFRGALLIYICWGMTENDAFN